MKQKEIKLKPVEKQVIVITGASSGIGLTTAEMAAELGAKVVLSSRNAKEIRRISHRLNEAGADTIAFAADVSICEEVEALKDEALKKYGRIDTWINNAGVSLYGPLLETPIEDEKKVFETNFWGIRNGCRVAIPVLAKEGGALINLGSEVSTAAIPLQGIYSATKHAIKAYTDALRMELEKENIPISVTLVRPSGIDTPYTKHAVNYLKKRAPSLPPPVYHVNIAAKAILKCAEKPQRDAYIGSASRFFEIMETLAPRLTDRFMKMNLFEQQSANLEEDHNIEEEALWTHPEHEGEKTGDHEGHVSQSSLYTKVTVGQKKIKPSHEHHR